RPPDNRDPTPAEIKACRPYLDAELLAVKAKYIITSGRFSSKSVLKKSKITQEHGQIVDLPNERKGMPVYHPAYCLRDPSKKPGLQQDLARLRNIIDGVETTVLPKWRKVEDLETLDKFLRKFSEAEEFSYDLETSGLFPFHRKGAIRCISIGLPEGAWVIPMQMPGGLFFGDYEVQFKFFRLLVKMALEEDKLAIAQNGKFDQHWQNLVFGCCFPLHFDTMLASHLIDENEDHDLKYLARRWLDAPEYDIPKKEKQGKFLHIPEKRET